MAYSYRYKLIPTQKQKEQIEKTFTASRFVYNWGLERKKNDIKASFDNPRSFIGLSKELTEYKKTHKWLYEVPNASLQLALRDLDSDFSHFFRQKTNYPSFKNKKQDFGCAKYNLSVHFDFKKWKVKIPNCKWVKICKNKTFDPIFDKMGTLTVYKDECGEYWCTINVSTEDYFLVTTQIEDENTLGIKIGEEKYVTCSNGDSWGSINDLKKSLNNVTHKDKVCKERKRMNIVRDFIHRITSKLMKSRYTTFCIENSSPRKGFEVLDNEFLNQMEYKSDYYVKNLIKIGNLDDTNEDLLEDAKLIKQIALNKQNLVGIDASIKPTR